MCRRSPAFRQGRATAWRLLAGCAMMAISHAVARLLWFAATGFSPRWQHRKMRRILASAHLDQATHCTRVARDAWREKSQTELRWSIKPTPCILDFLPRTYIRQVGIGHSPSRFTLSSSLALSLSPSLPLTLWILPISLCPCPLARCDLSPSFPLSLSPSLPLSLCPGLPVSLSPSLCSHVCHLFVARCEFRACGKMPSVCAGGTTATRCAKYELKFHPSRRTGGSPGGI
jgi:hypothetical protein